MSTKNETATSKTRDCGATVKPVSRVRIPASVKEQVNAITAILMTPPEIKPKVVKPKRVLDPEQRQILLDRLEKARARRSLLKKT